jgi:hypothetical protein
MSSMVVRNESAGLMCIYIEPYPNDYWLRPSEAVRISGVPGTAEIEMIRFTNGPPREEDGLTLYFGEDPDPTVQTLDGIPLPSGHQRPSARRDI